MSEDSDGSEHLPWDESGEDEGSEHGGASAVDPRIVALYGKYQRVIDIDAVRHVRERRFEMSEALADDKIPIRAKLRQFIDMLDSWPILWRDLPASYDLDPRSNLLRKFFDDPPPGSGLTHKAIARHAGLSAALDFIVDAYDYDRGRFDRAPLEFHDDLTELAASLAIQVSTGARDALAKAPSHAADPASSSGRSTSSPAVPGSVFAPGHVVPTGGAAASPSISIDALGSAQHHCREAVGGAPRLTNAQVKKLPKKARAQYKAQLEALEDMHSSRPTTGRERRGTPRPCPGEQCHNLQGTPLLCRLPAVPLPVPSPRRAPAAESGRTRGPDSRSRLPEAPGIDGRIWDVTETRPQ